MTTIGLTMIVKNEAGVIGRALDSVRPIIDHVLICDTGSQDGTQQVIRAWLRRNNMPGEVIARPWVDFAHNRNEGIDALRTVPGIDYALTIDADEYLVPDPGFDLASLRQTAANSDGWWIVSREGPNQFKRLQLFSIRKPFTFRYKMHEILMSPDGAKLETAQNFFNCYTREGARARNPNKFLDDAEIIQRELATDTDPLAQRHYTYFLAQSHAGAGQFEAARDTYLRRADMPGNSEGTAMCYFYAALCMEELGEPAERVIAMFLRAGDLAPTRAEPLCGAARVANENGLHEHAYHLARAAIDMPLPDLIFVELASYTWRALDEFQVAAVGLGHFGEALEASERLLSENKFPESERARIEANAAYALARYDLADAASNLPTSSSH